MKTSFVVIMVLLTIIGCKMPSTVVRTTDIRPSIAIQGAPGNSKLYVDGLQIGDANIYDGQPKTLLVEPGIHQIIIKDTSGKIIYEQKIFVESELKTIQIQ